MENENKLILQGNEHLWDVALRSIGIFLPDEYVLRFVMLLEKTKEVGSLDQISLNDVVDIEKSAHEEFVKRMGDGKE